MRVPHLLGLSRDEVAIMPFLARSSAVARAQGAGAVVLGAAEEDIWAVAGEPQAYGPAPTQQIMDVDIDVDVICVQNNLQDHTTNNNLILNVGVDPAVALKLQREADEACAQAATIAAAAAEQEITRFHIM